LPEASGGIAGALQNDGIVAHDADGFGVETSLESMIAELANGKEGTVGKVREKMGSSSSKWERW
jgi:hypothetical protein